MIFYNFFEFIVLFNLIFNPDCQLFYTLPEFINDQFLLTFEFNLKKLSKFDFHCLSIFLYDLKLIWLKNFYDVIKLNPWISLKYTNIQDFLGLSIDDKFMDMVMLLLLKNESHGDLSLFGNIVLFAFHGDILFLLLRSLTLLIDLKV